MFQFNWLKNAWIKSQHIVSNLVCQESITVYHPAHRKFWNDLWMIQPWAASGQWNIAVLTCPKIKREVHLEATGTMSIVQEKRADCELDPTISFEIGIFLNKWNEFQWELWNYFKRNTLILSNCNFKWSTPNLSQPLFWIKSYGRKLQLQILLHYEVREPPW